MRTKYELCNYYHITVLIRIKNRFNDNNIRHKNDGAIAIDRPVYGIRLCNYQ